MFRKYIYLLILILCFTSISEASLHRSVSLEMRRTVQNMSYAYDLTANPISKATPDEITVGYVYDNLNRLTSINFPDSSQDISYSYDSTGKVLSMTDPSGTTAYVYDSSNRLTTETKTIEGKTFNTSYSYTLSGALTAITYPSGRIISYEYDPIGRIVKVIEEKDGKRQEIIKDIAYLSSGAISSITQGNNLITTKTYDNRNQLSSLSIGNLKQLSYARDNVGNITAITDVLDSTKTKTFAYDALYRLTQATGIWGTISYNYDSVGNRLTENSSAGVTNYSYSANKLITSTGAKAFTFSYDNNGNTVSENQKTYIYNQNQRLIKAVEDSKVLGEYVYNANGQRVKKTVDGKITYFIYDQIGSLIGEYDEQGQVNIDYIYLGSVPIARVDEWWEGMPVPQAPTDLNLIPGDKQLTVSWTANQEPMDGYKVYWGTASGNYTSSVDVGDVATHTITGLTNGTTYYVSVTSYADLKETYFYHTDHLGTPILMTNGSGTLVWEGELLPFGERYSVKGKTTNNIALLGQYHDVETGLSYNWHRTQDPNIGRFTTYDPSLRLRGSPEIPYLLPSLLYSPHELNPYIHALNNPVLHTDPFGLMVEICSQKAKIPILGEVAHHLGFDHQWLKTDTIEAGMGPYFKLLDELPLPVPYAPVTITDHKGRSKQPGSSCKEVECVREECVNYALKHGMGKFLGFWSMSNNCNTLANEILSICRIKK